MAGTDSAAPFDPYLEGKRISDIAQEKGISVPDVVRWVFRKDVSACWLYDGFLYRLDQTKAADRATVDPNSIIERWLPRDILKKLILNDPSEVELERIDAHGHKWLVTTSISSSTVFVEAGAVSDHLGESGRWPWGNHETGLLRKLEAWQFYDPADPTTAPTNQQVIDWLEQQGVSHRTAEVIATILRADDLLSGPRK